MTAPDITHTHTHTHTQVFKVFCVADPGRTSTTLSPVLRVPLRPAGLSSRTCLMKMPLITSPLLRRLPMPRPPTMLMPRDLPGSRCSSTLRGTHTHNSIKLYLYSAKTIQLSQGSLQSPVSPLRASTLATRGKKKLPVNQEETLSRTAAHKGETHLLGAGRVEIEGR